MSSDIREAIHIIVSTLSTCMAMVFMIVAVVTTNPETEKKALLWAILMLLWAK